MKIFGYEISRAERKASAAPSDLLREMLADAQAKSGVSVTWQTALQADTALACARVIAEGLAQVPLKVYRKRPGGGADVATDHPAYALLHDAPNAIQTSYDWRETVGMHLVFAGNDYAYKVKHGGDVTELLPFDPSSVEVRNVKGELRYDIRLEGGGKESNIGAADMLHLRGPSWNGWQGLDGVKLVKEAIGLAIATERHGAKLFSNGAEPGGLLYTEAGTTITEEQRKLLRESWQETHGGVDNAHKTAILWGGLKWMPLTQQNDHAQFLETRAFQVEEVCRGFRVLPVMVGHSDKAATYASAEQMFLAHVVHTMGPWYARLEQAFNRQILTEADRRAGVYAKFNIGGLLRGAHEARASYFSKALGAGGSPAWMTQDEVRELDELNPMGGTAAQLPVATNVGGPAPKGA